MGKRVGVLVVSLFAVLLAACGEDVSEVRGTPLPATSLPENTIVASVTEAPATRTATAAPTPTVTPRPSPTATVVLPTDEEVAIPPAPQPILRFGKLVSPGDRAVIEAGILLAQRYLKSLGLVGAPAVTVYAFVDLDNVTVRWERIREESGLPQRTITTGLAVYVAQAFPGYIFINAGAVNWSTLPAVEQVRLAAHEYFHNVQLSLSHDDNARGFYLGPVDVVGPLGPMWLLEGSAELLSWRSMEYAGLADLEQYLREEPDIAVHPADIETFTGFARWGQASYGFALRTTLLLLGERSPEAILTYFERIGQGETWQDAFAGAFSTGVDQFYDDLR